MAEITKEHTSNPGVPVVGGKLLYYAFLAGGTRVLQTQAEVNQINVFPVSDKDTGTNMASTVRWVMDNIRPHRSYKTTVTLIAEAALTGARGNSGVIFAQFLHGLSSETQNKSMLTLPEFAESVARSIPYIYQAIANPVEGTMLSVIRVWSEFLQQRKHEIHDFKKVFIDSFRVLEDALENTTQQLEVLKNSGYVDAGAKGFVEFVQGIIHFLGHRNPRSLRQSADAILPIDTHEPGEADLRYRFCTEAMLKKVQLPLSRLQEILNEYGDSGVVAGSEALCRIHVHTSQPAQLFQQLSTLATLSYQKADDMQRQQEVMNKRKWNIALVCDSTCDLSDELLEHYQVHTLPMNLYFGENHFLDKRTMQPEQFYHELDTNPQFPKTAQINEQAFTNLYAHLASHYDAIIALHLTAHFSGTWANSVKAAQAVAREMGKPVYVIDSKSLSGALGLLVLKAAQLIEQGKAADAIVESLRQATRQTRIFVSVKNLNSMIRGGRVSKPKGFIANALGINPVISMDENGKSLLFGKTFSQRASLNKIYRHIQSISGKKQLWNYIVLHAQNPELAREVENKMTALFGRAPVSVVNISPVIGMHAGKGAVAVAVMYND